MKKIRRSLIKSSRDYNFPINIELIISNNVKAEGLVFAKKYGIPFKYFSSKNIKKFDAFIALGCVIKGQTPHFDFISLATTNAIIEISINSKKPVGNGIITCLNFNQAVKRKFKGKEAAEAVLSILSQ